MAVVDAEVQQAWRAPVLVRVNTETPDGRLMRAIDWRDLPLPLKWQKADTDGHDQSIIVGRIDTIEMSDDTTVTAAGVFDTSPDALEAARLVREQMLRGVSVDPGGVGAVEVTERDDGSMLMEFESYTIGGATLVAIPAFPDAALQLVDDGGELAALDEEMAAKKKKKREDEPMPKGHPKPMMGSDALAALIASARPDPNAPSPSVFTQPDCVRREPLHVEADRRVWGHVYGWGECHRGSPAGSCVQAPRSRTNYAHFCNTGGGVLCDDGTFVPTGAITLGGEHADKRLGIRAATRHYEDTTMAVADVVCGEDDYGIWVAGVMRPGVSDETVYALRASHVSGDWRWLAGGLEMIAVHAVNMGGFVPVRANALVADGHVLSLIASGAMADEHHECSCGGMSAELLQMEGPDLAELAAKVDEVHRIVTEPIRKQLATLDGDMTPPVVEDPLEVLDEEMAEA